MFKGLNFHHFCVGLLIILLSPPLSVSAKEEIAEDQRRHFAVFSLNNSFPALSKSKVRMIYKGKVKRINKEHIDLVDLTEESNDKAHFYQNLLGKSLSQMNGYRASLAFSGKGNLPVTISNNDIASIIDWLEDHPNGIAYATIKSLPKNVNVLFVLDPEE
ncbi:hypothetical protein [Moritella sp. Urea-trap-13]|uniref:hypothetical protein n=1 Tax=Moritella sp. Urea-trap-13 TaxID=2058327 RepID=UPI000C326A8F|nr:hypothetical protein [Moritella sp. Urea-trap-13]PKH06521.1 hypothetical protein CXF93_11480 [Moritella sp. Urea-trap-13]